VWRCGRCPAADDPERSWVEVLRAAVREEFQHEVYWPRPGDPVLFGPTCAVQGCPGRGVNRSLGLKAKGANRSTGTRFRGYVCLAHVGMWRRDGEPPIDAWVRHAARARRSQALPDGCLVGACRRSTNAYGFCAMHRRRWERAGRPGDRVAFAATETAGPAGDERCAVAACRFPTVAKQKLCDGHLQRYRNARYCCPQLTAAGYLEHLAAARCVSAPKFDMRGVPGVVRLELQYALQCRH